MTDERSSEIALPRPHIRVLKKLEIPNQFGSEYKGEQAKGSNPVQPVIKESFLWMGGALNNLVAAKEKGMIKANQPKDFPEVLDLEYMPLNDIPATLGHITDPESFFRQVNAPVWGDPDKQEFTYLQTTDFTVEAYQENDYMISLGGKPMQFVRVYVDTGKLKDVRNIYLDPESIDITPEDFGKSFVVRGGLPKESIVSAELIEVSPQPFDNFLEDVREIPSEDVILEEAVKNEERLSRFVDQLAA